MTGRGPIAAAGGAVRQDRRTLVAPAVVAAVVVVAFLPILVAAVTTGGWGIPHNDDWDYTRTALTLHSTGQLRFSGWGQMTLVGQILVSQPLLFIHNSIGTLDALGLASAVVLVFVVWLLARTVLRPGRALLAATVVAACPVVAVLSVTYMTDLPSAALQGMCLTFGAVGFERGARTRRGFVPHWIAAALFVGLVACSIRENALAAPLSVGLVALWQGRRCEEHRLDRFLLAAGLAFIGGFAALLAWRHGQPGAAPIGVSLLHNAAEVPLATFKLFCVLALCLLPLLIIMPWRRLLASAGRATSVVALASGALAAAAAWLLASTRGSALPGNTLTKDGVGGQQLLSGTRPALLTAPQWLNLQYLAAVAVGMLVVVAVIVAGGMARDRWGRAANREPLPAQQLLILVAAVTSVLAMVATVSSTGGFDRYIVPLLISFPVLAGLTAQMSDESVRPRPLDVGRLFRAAPRFVPAGLTVVSLILLAGVGYVESASSNAYDNARWHAGQAVAAASPALRLDRIDAGFEWVGFHARWPLTRPTLVFPFTFYEGKFGLAPCAVVSNQAINGNGESSTLVGEPLTRWTDLYGTVRTLYVFTTTTPRSSPPPGVPLPSPRSGATAPPRC